MKNKKFTKTISLIMAMLMTLSAIGITSVFAANETDLYTITASTAGRDGVTKNDLSFKLYGTDGTSTDWVTKACGKNKGISSFTFEGNYIGTEIEKVEIKVNGDDGWFPNYINVTSEKGKIDKTFYGGRWLDNSQTLTFKGSDNVFKISIDTADVYLAGTDCDVHMALIDKNGKKVTFENLHDIHPKSNAFERDDSMSAYIACPDNFGKLQYVELWTEIAPASETNAKWMIERVTAEQVSGTYANMKKTNPDGSIEYVNDSFSVKLDMWLGAYGTVADIGRESGKTGIFKISCKTGNDTGAGTDAFMYCTINGTNGSTQKANFLANMSPYCSDSDLFEKKELNTGIHPFAIKSYKNGIGTLTSVTIELNEKEYFDWVNPWLLEYIEIEEVLPDGMTGQKIHIDHNKWFDSNDIKTLYP